MLSWREIGYKKRIISIHNIVIFGKNSTIRDVKHSAMTFVLYQSELKRFVDKKKKVT